MVSVESLPQACAQVIRAVCGLCEQLVHADLSVLLSGALPSQAAVNEAALPVGGPGQGSDLGDAFSVRLYSLEVRELHADTTRLPNRFPRVSSLCSD